MIDPSQPPKWIATSKNILFAALIALAGLGVLIEPIHAQLLDLLGAHALTKLLEIIAVSQVALRCLTAGGLTLSKRVADDAKQAQTAAADPSTPSGGVP